MPVYAYKDNDNTTMEVECPRADKPALDARMKGMGFRPDYRSVNFGAVMHAHWNPTTGTVVSSHRDFANQLRQASDARTEATGIPHSYVPADISDREALGVTDEGLASTHDRAVAEGRQDPTPRVW